MRWFRCVAVVAVTIVGWSATGLATETRQQTLQGTLGSQDEVQAFTFPGRLPMHRVALVELGTAGNTEVYGAALAGKSALSAGLAVSRSNWIFTSPLAGAELSLFERYEGAITSTSNGGPILVAPARPVEFLGAFRLGRDQAVGVRFAGASYKTSTSTGEDAAKRETRQLAEQADATFGWTGPTGDGALDMSLNLQVLARQKRIEKASGVTSGTKVKGKNGMQLAGRWLASRDRSGPFFGGTYASRTFSVTTETAVDDKASKFDESFMVLEGGYALLLPTNNAKLFCGADVASTKSKGPTVTGAGGATTPSYMARDDKAQVKGDLISATLAGEGDISGGLGAALGLRYALLGTVTEKDKTSGVLRKTEKTVDETPDANLWSLGVYYRVDALRIDGSYSKAFLHNGPFLVSGSATSPLFGRLSASYEF